MAVILFIDDDLGSRVLYEKACTLLGHQSLLAESGERGIAIALADQPDLILLDFSLPDLDGLAVLTRLKEEYSTARIPVVIVSAGISEQESQVTHEAGAVAFLNKPIGLNELQQTIHQFSVA